MPAKKAAGEAPKAEKPVEDKKQAVQKDAPAKGQQKAQGGQGQQKAAQGGQGQQKAQQGGQQKQQGGQNSQGGQGQQEAPRDGRPAIVLDAKETAIMRKMDAIAAKITDYKGEMDKIKIALDEEKKFREGLFTEQTTLRDQKTEVSSSSIAASQGRKATIDKIKDFRLARDHKQAEAKAIRLRLPIVPTGDDSPAGQESYLRKLEDEIRSLERGLSSGSVSLAAEKKKIEEISQVQKAKKTYKEYMAVNEKINLDTKNIKALEAELDQTKGTHEVNFAARTSIDGKLSEVNTRIVESKKKTAEGNEKRAAIRDDIDKAYAEQNVEKDNLAAYRQQKWKDQQAKAQLEWQKEKARRQEFQERKNKYAAEREQREALIETPYEEEMDLCTTLANYLESLLPPKPKEVAPTTTTTSAPLPTSDDVTILKKDDAEEFVGKKKLGKKPKAVKITQDLRHDVSIFSHFETLSLTPPAKLADIEGSIAELKAKQAHYRQLSKEKLEALTAAKNAKKAAQQAATNGSASATEATKQPEPTAIAATGGEAVVAE